MAPQQIPFQQCGADGFFRHVKRGLLGKEGHRKKTPLCHDRSSSPMSKSQEQLVIEKSTVAIVAEHIAKWAKRAESSKAVEKLMETMSWQYGTAMKWLECVAELSARAEEQSLHAVLRYISALTRSGTIKPLLFSVHNSYDETPLRARVAFLQMGQAASQTELAKVFVIEQSWVALLEVPQPNHDKNEHVILMGALAPALRCSDAANGEAVAAVLSSVRDRQIPGDVDVTALFALPSRSLDTDEAGANPRGERLYASWAPKWKKLHLGCAAHRLHGAAERVFQLVPPVLTGVVRVLLSLRSSASWSQFKTVLETEIENRCTCRPLAVPLPESALQYRRNVLTTWRPPHQSRKVILLDVLTGVLLNGDWRDRGVLIHHCREGCCSSAAETVTKVKYYIGKFVDSFRPSALCRGNWASWSAPLSFLGLMGSNHNLLPDVFAKSFQATSSWTWGVPSRA